MDIEIIKLCTKYKCIHDVSNNVHCVLLHDNTYGIQFIINNSLDDDSFTIHRIYCMNIFCRKNDYACNVKISNMSDVFEIIHKCVVANNDEKPCEKASILKVLDSISELPGSRVIN